MSSQADILSVQYDAAVASREAAMFAGSPHVVLKPKIYPDGTMWCVLLGENLQEGISGFGETPIKACLEFDQAWYHSKTPDAALAAIAQGPGAGQADPVKDFRKRALDAIQNLRHAAACNFTPAYMGSLGEARLDSFHEAYKAIEAVEALPPPAPPPATNVGA